MEMLICPKCGRELPEDSSTCLYCGYQIKEKNLIVCPECGVMCDERSSFCPECGHNFKSIGSANKNVAHSTSKPPSRKSAPQKKRSKLPLVIILIVLILIMCAILVFKWALENGKIEVRLPDSTNSTENSGSIDVDKGLFNVQITVPKDFCEGATQEDLDKESSEKGYKSATLNDDGSVTYIMTKSQHKNMMNDMKDNIDQELQNMIGSSDYPNITSIEANDDYTKLTVTTTSPELSMEESLSVFQFYVYGGMYNAFNGTPIDNVHVDFVNSESGNIIFSADSKYIEDTEDTE